MAHKSSTDQELFQCPAYSRGGRAAELWYLRHCACVVAPVFSKFALPVCKVRLAAHTFCLHNYLLRYKLDLKTISVDISYSVCNS